MGDFIGAVLSLLFVIAIIAGFIAYPEEIFKFSLWSIAYIILGCIAISILLVVLKGIFIAIFNIWEALDNGMNGLVDFWDKVREKTIVKVAVILFYIFIVIFLGIFLWTGGHPLN